METVFVAVPEEPPDGGQAPVAAEQSAATSPALLVAKIIAACVVFSSVVLGASLLVLVYGPMPLPPKCPAENQTAPLVWYADGDVGACVDAFVTPTEILVDTVPIAPTAKHTCFPVEPTGSVVAVSWGGAVAFAARFVAHAATPHGACASPADARAVAEHESTVARTSAVCVGRCMLQHSCLEKCFASTLGVSQACAGCFAGDTYCVAAHCVFAGDAVCRPGHETSTLCAECAQTNCDGALRNCTGLPAGPA